VTDKPYIYTPGYEGPREVKIIPGRWRLHCTTCGKITGHVPHGVDNILLKCLECDGCLRTLKLDHKQLLRSIGQIPADL
jgi:hypothetical protein